MQKILVYGMTDNRGGMESYIHNIYQNLDKNRYQFDFVCDFPDMVLKDYYLSQGSTIYFIPPKNKGLFKHLISMYKIIKQGGYKIVYFNIMNAGYALNMLPAYLLGCKIIAHSHNAGTHKIRIHQLFKGLLKRLAKTKLACSEVAGQFMFGDDTCYSVINNGIDLDKYQFSDAAYHAIRKQFAWDNKKIILHVARMDQQKNPHFVLDIMKRINRLDKDIHLAYVGDGPMKAELIERIKNENIQNISLLGIREDIPQLMIAADVFILPSLFEGLPITAIEAQASGSPLLLSENISPATKILDTTEFLPISHADTWANEIIKCLNAPVVRENKSNILRQHGYDIKDSTRILENILSC